MSESDYEEGSKAAWRRILSEALRALGNDAPDAARLSLERSEAVAALRQHCEDRGLSTDWPDDLHLADIVTRHLA